MNDHAMMSGKVAGIYLGILACAGAARSWTVKPKTAQAPITAAINPARWTAVPLPARAFTLTTHAGCFWAAGAREMIARSCDEGKSWVVLHWKQKGQPIYDLAFTGAQSLFAYGGNGKRWGSRNDGRTWDSKRVYMYQPPLSMQYLNAHEGMLIMGDYLRVRLQNSHHWKDLPFRFFSQPTATQTTIPVELSSLAMINSRYAAALAKPRTFNITTDGGRHWHLQTLPANMRVLRLDAAGNDYLASVQLTQPLPARRAMLYSPDGTSWHQLSAGFISRLRHCRHGQCLLDKGWVRLRHAPKGNWQAQGWRLAPAAPDRHLPWAAIQNTLCFTAAQLYCAQGTLSPADMLLYTPAELRAMANQQKAAATTIYIPNPHDNLTPTLCLICYVPMAPLQLSPPHKPSQVIMHAIFRRNGTVQSLKIIASPSIRLAQIAFDSAQYWRLAPILRQGKTVKSKITIQIKFSAAKIHIYIKWL